jgi:hypothetical protein
MTRDIGEDLLLDESTGHRWRLVERDADAAGVVEDWVDEETGEHRCRVCFAA